MRASIVWAVAACALATDTAIAQVYVEPPPSIQDSPALVTDVRENYRVQLGPAYFRPTLLLKELGVDTNVYNEAGEGRSDFTATVTPQTDVAVPFGRRGLVTSTVGVDFVYFAHFASERSIDPRVALSGAFFTRWVTPFVEGSYLNTRERLDYAIDIRARHQENEVAGGAAIRVTSKSSVELSRRHGVIRFDEGSVAYGQDLQKTLNRDADIFRVTAAYKHSVLTMMALRYESQTDRFPYAPVRDTDSHRIVAGVAFAPRALINGNAWVGYRRFTPRARVLAERSGPVAQLALSYTLLGSTTFGVRYSHDYSFSYLETTPYYVDNSIGAFVRRAVARRVDVVGSVSRHQYSYESVAAAIGVTTDAPVETTYVYGGDVGYLLRQRVRVGFAVAYRTRRTVDTSVIRNYDDLRIGTTMTYGF